MTTVLNSSSSSSTSSTSTLITMASSPVPTYSTQQLVQEGESVILEMNDDSRHFLQALKGQ